MSEGNWFIVFIFLFNHLNSLLFNYKFWRNIRIIVFIIWSILMMMSYIHAFYMIWRFRMIAFLFFIRGYFSNVLLSKWSFIQIIYFTIYWLILLCFIASRIVRAFIRIVWKTIIWLLLWTYLFNIKFWHLIIWINLFI